MRGSEIHVAIASNDAYVPWAATLMRSGLDHHVGGSLVFHLLHDGIEASVLERLDAFVRGSGGRLVSHAIDMSRLDELGSVGRFGAIVWSLFLLPDLLADQPRTLYLDADTFIVEPLDELWHAHLEAPVAAVANVVEPSLHAYIRALGLDPRRFLNSGVLLMNLDAMRREDTMGRLASFVATHERLRWPDQDALNVLYEQRWEPLHPRWNTMNSFWTWEGWAEEVHGVSAIAEAKAAPAILHFEGPSISKPWHLLCSHPYRYAYRAALERTPWSRTPLEGRTPMNRTLALLPSRWWMPAFVTASRLRSRVARLTRRT